MSVSLVLSLSLSVFLEHEGKKGEMRAQLSSFGVHTLNESVNLVVLARTTRKIDIVNASVLFQVLSRSPG